MKHSRKKRKHEIVHFGYSANLGGVEVFIRNANNGMELPISLLVTTDAPLPFEVEFTGKGGSIYRICSRRENPFKYIADLIRFFATHQDVGILHIHLNTCSSIAPAVIGRCFGCICIAHSHNSSVWAGRVTKVLHTINKAFLPLFAQYRFACSESAGKYMFGKRRFEVFKNGIDVNAMSFSASGRERIRQAFGLEDAFVVGHVGKLCYIKNQSFLLDIFEQLHKIKPNSALLLVGEGADQAQLEEKVRAANLTDSVIFAGRRGDVADLLSAMDIFVFPSLFEGLPFTLVEAQASGLPILASDTVTNEVRLTDLVEFVSLNEPPTFWAERITQTTAGAGRGGYAEVLNRAGYNAKTTAEKLQNFYLEHLNG